MKMRYYILISILILLLGVVGKYIYTLYASEYERKQSFEAPVIEHNDHLLRVGTYNIKSMNYTDSQEFFRKEIQDVNLDVLVLQEVDQNAVRSGNLDMVKAIAQAGDFPYYHFYTTMWILDGYYGIGIVSKYPIIEVKAERMPNSLFKEPRVLSETTVQTKEKAIHIYNTHVTYEHNIYREEQLNFIKERVESQANTILMGDFNSFSFNGALEIDTMKSINSKQEFQTFKRRGSPDNIFYSNEFTLVEAYMQESTFSDHNLLYATLQYE